MPRIKRRATSRRERVARFENPFTMLMLKRETFFAELPTAEDRAEFREEFPAEFYDLFGFVDSGGEVFPASVEYKTNVFKRPDFVQFMAQHKIRIPFEPPDVSALPWLERYRVLAVARGEWWRVNGLPMTAKERAWLEREERRDAKASA